jgi:hypothetical protein
MKGDLKGNLKGDFEGRFCNCLYYGENSRTSLVRLVRTDEKLITTRDVEFLFIINFKGEVYARHICLKTT